MRSLRFRLSLWFSLAVTATAGTAIWIGYLIVEQQVMDGIDFLLEAEIQEVEARLADLPNASTASQFAAELTNHTEIDAPLYYFQVHHQPGTVVFRSRNLGEHVLPDISEGNIVVGTIQLGDERVRLRERAFRGFHIQVASNLEQVEASLERYRQTLWLVLPPLFIASVATGWLLATLALRPVGAMQRSARRISASNLGERLPVPKGRDEISGLARLLNDLFARLEASFEQIRRFTADASHELKTPLSLIRLHAGRLADSPRLSEAERSEIEGQVEEINRLNKLIDNLLLLARADAGTLPLDRRMGNTARFIDEFGEDASALAEDRGLRFIIERNPPAEVAFDAVMIRQVLLNILANALRHTPDGSAIHLTSAINDESWEIAVEDEGSGLPADECERIFGRFVRGHGAEDRAPGGSGLGLSIARGIVEAHGGGIRAGNRTGASGLRVAMWIPRAATPAGVVTGA